MKEDAHFVECNKCKEQISGGMTNLVQHLRKHSEEFKKYEKEKDANALKEWKQLSLEETEDRIRPWKVNDPRAQQITRRLVEMVALDSQLLSRTVDS